MCTSYDLFYGGHCSLGKLGSAQPHSSLPKSVFIFFGHDTKVVKQSLTFLRRGIMGHRGMHCTEFGARQTLVLLCSPLV